jgi:hypothetical protein
MATKENLSLPAFQERLRGYRGKLPAGTYWRYSQGIFPDFVHFIVQHLDLADAFAEDIKALSRKENLTTENNTPAAKPEPIQVETISDLQRRKGPQ